MNLSIQTYAHTSFQAVTDERGKVLGAVPMEFRSNNFGPPLFCNNRSSFVHLDNRQNKSARYMRIFDSSAIYHVLKWKVDFFYDFFTTTFANVW